MDISADMIRLVRRGQMHSTKVDLMASSLGLCMSNRASDPKLRRFRRPEDSIV